MERTCICSRDANLLEDYPSDEEEPLGNNGRDSKTFSKKMCIMNAKNCKYATFKRREKVDITESDNIAESILSNIETGVVPNHILDHLDIILDYVFGLLNERKKNQLLDYVFEECPDVFPIIEDLIDCILLYKVSRNDLKNGFLNMKM